MADQLHEAPVSDFGTALAHARRLMAARPDLGEQQAREILTALPGHPEALLLLGLAQRLQGDLSGAREILVRLAAGQPQAAAVHYEAGVTLGALGETELAIEALTLASRLSPEGAHIWRALGDQLTCIGDHAAADRCCQSNAKTSPL